MSGWKYLGWNYTGSQFLEGGRGGGVAGKKGDDPFQRVAVLTQKINIWIISCFSVVTKNLN